MDGDLQVMLCRGERLVEPEDLVAQEKPALKGKAALD